MKNSLNEELNRLKYLLGYKPGQLMTESQVKETYLDEQFKKRNPKKGQLAPDNSKEKQKLLNKERKIKKNLPNWGPLSTPETGPIDMSLGYGRPTANVVIDNEIYHISIGRSADRFIGPSKETTTKITTPPPLTIPPETILDKYEISGDKFPVNIITVQEPAKEIIRNKSVNPIFNYFKSKFKTNKNIEELVNLLGNGIQVTGEADADPPIANAIRDTDVVKDHANSGYILYGGATTPEGRNEFLAKMRATNVYNVIVDELYEKLKELDIELADAVKSKLVDLKANSINTINHVALKDGLRGLEYRKVIVEPLTLMNVTKGETQYFPPTKETETKIKPGSVEEIIPYFKVVGKPETIDVYTTLDDYTLGGNRYFGVEQSIAESLPIIGNTTFNGKTKLSLTINGAEEFILDGYNLGKLKSGKSMGLGINKQTTGAICRIGEGMGGQKIREYKGKTYVPVTMVYGAIQPGLGF